MTEDKYGYQTIIAKKILADVENENYLGTILAGAVNSGKTEIAAIIINELIKRTDYPIIWLAHAQNSLKNQTITTLQSLEGPIKPLFSAGNLESNKEVLVTIPPELSRKKHIPKFEYLIIDESHEWFASNTVMDIIAEYKPKLILLTGTPSLFVKYNNHSTSKKFKMHFISGEEMIDRGLYSKVEIDLIRIPDMTKDNFPRTISGKNIHAISKPTLEGLIVNAFMEKYRKCGFNITKSKIMIVCKSTNQASNISAILKSKGLYTYLSTTENDPKGTELEEFKLSNSGAFLIVVGRGVLGMNFNQLNLILDLSESWNASRSLQLLGRVFRKNPRINIKYFWRMSFQSDWNKHIYFIKDVLSLLKSENMKCFEGTF